MPWHTGGSRQREACVPEGVPIQALSPPFPSQPPANASWEPAHDSPSDCACHTCEDLGLLALAWSRHGYWRHLGMALRMEDYCAVLPFKQIKAHSPLSLTPQKSGQKYWYTGMYLGNSKSYEQLNIQIFHTSKLPPQN